ncbi:hypothetical protein HPB49_003117 [Dermacentor silvarum]|uniref:Uncharacterized protein n=1 Tax=Dermacentor silvarum TaxID=543639 RepID=A0ACB8DSZ6_DERSI|nr:hypothetical protein HPB49_003117 [Dermacentor silvarum]
MTSQGVTPGQKRQLICTSQPDCKRQDTGDSEDESTIIEDDNVANLSDLDMDEGGFRVVRHRKDRAEGIPVLITAASERADLRQVNPILLYSELEAILGGAPVKSRFTAQGALLLDVETEGQANILLETKNIGGIAISSRVPHSYMKNTCIVRGVPKWYSDEELLTFLRPQGVFHAKRIIRRVHTSSSEWESRRTNSVVLTFAPNSERPEKINLGFTRHELVDYVETPPRCFKCQRFGHIAKYCRGEQRCKRCGGPHDFKTRRIAISQEVKSATSHTQYCNRLRPIVKRVSGNSCCGYQGTREFEAMRLLMPPPENFYTGAPPIPPQHNFSLTGMILSPFFHILRSYNTSG